MSPPARKRQRSKAYPRAGAEEELFRDLREANENLLQAALREQALTEQLERNLKTREHMLRVMTHDVATPMLSIALAADVLLHQSDQRTQPPAVQRALAALDVAARQVRALLGELLDFSELDRTGQLPLRLGEQRLSEVIREAQALVQPLADSAGIELVAPSVRRDGVLSCDRPRLVRALFNVLVNAIKFTPAGGRVQVAAGCSPRKATIEITDTGVGIAAEDLPRVFDAHFTGSRGSGTGAGLGLFITKGTVTAHRGRIEIGSRARGRGTRVTITLPR